MPTLIEIRDAHKRYGEQSLLDGASCTLGDEAKVGFIGRNGCGKSTLCRVLLGEEELDSGEVSFHPRLRLGYLRQHDPFEPGETVLGFLLRDSRQPEWRCGEVAGQFDIKGSRLEGPVDVLSGGWQTRLKLAALLLHDPNLLVLDEPTNFLDLRTQIMLERFLRNFRGGCLIVSHDRAFLKATCDHTLELSRGKLSMFPGDVDVYLEQQRERRQHDERVNAATATKRRQLERFIAKNRAGANTASQARSKTKQLDRLELIDVDGPESEVRMRVPEVEPRKGTALRCTGMSIGYENLTVAEGIDLEIEHGARVALVGDNGQGKTTFLRSVVNSLPLLAGVARWGHGCQLGCYAQHVYTGLPEDWTIEEYLQRAAAAGTTHQMVLNVAGNFLFSGDTVNKKIKVLSGGERARLCLAGILLGRHTVLVLDEPGNHLDVESVDALADALIGYQGTILFTSHDRHFMHRVATGVIEVRDGRVVNYLGDYDSYVYRVNKEIEDGQRELAKSKSAGKPAAAQVDRKQQNRRRQSLRKEISNLERKIARLDESRRDLNEQLMSSTDAAEAAKLHEQVTEVAGELQTLEDRWLELQEEQ
ncbi:MAG: ABC-F family ATP-binding cassette domain-containing protein [Planctomycetes bacterium]|nr:ABC-F family ATP-binding cassette domain-containing protein [Planctomycetota bacterium]